MKEVSKEYFASKIYKLDVTVYPKGKFPFTTDFKLRNGNLIGKEVESLPYPITTKYYTNL
jgi:hypothetical protein